MGIPLYGQNKDGGILNLWADCLKVIEFDLVTAASTTNANNTDIGHDIPANYLPIFSVVKNNGSAAMAGTTTRFDMETSETHLCGDLNGLAAGASIGYWIVGGLSAANTVAIDDGNTFTAAKNILTDGDMFTSSGAGSLHVRIWCLDATALVGLDLSSTPR